MILIEKIPFNSLNVLRYVCCCFRSLCLLYIIFNNLAKKTSVAELWILFFLTFSQIVYNHSSIIGEKCRDFQSNCERLAKHNHYVTDKKFIYIRSLSDSIQISHYFSCFKHFIRYSLIFDDTDHNCQMNRIERKIEEMTVETIVIEKIDFGKKLPTQIACSFHRT